MRNPVRLKNLQLRFLPFAVLAAVVFAMVDADPLPLFAGSVLVLLGASLRFWGAGHLVKRRQLTVTGPYAYVRNPLYLGTLLVCFGFSVMVGGPLMLALMFFYGMWFFLDYFPRKDRSEGRRLEALYGASYVRYRNAVPALLPSLTPWRPEPSVAGCSVEGSWNAGRFVRNNELGTSLALALMCCLIALRVVGVA